MSDVLTDQHIELVKDYWCSLRGSKNHYDNNLFLDSHYDFTFFVRDPFFSLISKTNKVILYQICQAHQILSTFAQVNLSLTFSTYAYLARIASYNSVSIRKEPGNSFAGSSMKRKLFKTHTYSRELSMCFNRKTLNPLIDNFRFVVLDIPTSWMNKALLGVSANPVD